MTACPSQSCDTGLALVSTVEQAIVVMVRVWREHLIRFEMNSCSAKVLLAYDTPKMVD